MSNDDASRGATSSRESISDQLRSLSALLVVHAGTKAWAMHETPLLAADRIDQLNQRLAAQAETWCVIVDAHIAHNRELEKQLAARSETASRWQPISTAPKDGTLVLLLIGADDARVHPLEDTAEGSRTLGQNNFEHDGEDKWQFAGWCWDHDHYTAGEGTPTHWMPYPSAAASPAVTETPPRTAHSLSEYKRVTALGGKIDPPDAEPHDYAPAGKLWKCGVCGKTTRDRYAESGGWDETCMLHSFLIDDPMRGT